MGQGQEGGQKCFVYGMGKGEIGLLVVGVQIVIEDFVDVLCVVVMWDKEIFICSGFEVVIVIRVVWIVGQLQCIVEMLCIFRQFKVRVQVGFIVELSGVGCLEYFCVYMYCWGIGVVYMCYQIDF